ncbi:hypothetical protein [Bacillus massiliigorillae]|uniref:hypothetical protein n=1 Tax=Bacillus massiliigorillae TaxID=1243664 RepID=UPI0003A6C7A0|nr:hypothetical protein [Bacillus massiliigorillae]
MKRWLVFALCAISIFSILSGCSGDKESKQSIVNSGKVDKEYIGEPNPVLEEKFKQSEAEQKIQENVKKELSENKDELDGGGLSVH